MHDYVKTPAGMINATGWGHILPILHDYVKVNGEWKIIRGQTARRIVDEH